MTTRMRLLARPHIYRCMVELKPADAEKYGLESPAQLWACVSRDVMRRGLGITPAAAYLCWQIYREIEAESR